MWGIWASWLRFHINSTLCLESFKPSLSLWPHFINSSSLAKCLGSSDTSCYFPFRGPSFNYIFIFMMPFWKTPDHDPHVGRDEPVCSVIYPKHLCLTADLQQMSAEWTQLLFAISLSFPRFYYSLKILPRWWANNNDMQHLIKKNV